MLCSALCGPLCCGFGANYCESRGCSEPCYAKLCYGAIDVSSTHAWVGVCHLAGPLESVWFTLIRSGSSQFLFLCLYCWKQAGHGVLNIA